MTSSVCGKTDYGMVIVRFPFRERQLCVMT